MFYVLIITK